MHYIRRSYSCVLTKSSGTEPLSLTEAGTSPVALFRQKSIKVSRQLHSHRVCVCEREKEKGGKKGRKRKRKRETQRERSSPRSAIAPVPATPGRTTHTKPRRCFLESAGRLRIQLHILARGAPPVSGWLWAGLVPLHEPAQ
jgi:hypothetical protein